MSKKSKDSFICHKCNKEFTRQLHLNQHINRKIQCNRVIMCQRCFKEFSRISHLKRHINKKNKCENVNERLLLELKLEEIKLQRDEVNLKQEQEKTKQEQLKFKASKTPSIQIAGHDIINDNKHITFNVNIYTMTQSQAYDAITENKVETIRNILKHQYKNPEYPEDQCIFPVDGKVFIKRDNELISFDKLEPNIRKKIVDQVHNIWHNYEPYTDECINQNGWSQKKQLLPIYKIEQTNKIPLFVNNERNIAVLKSQLKKL
jgi:hypothetical protein